MSGENKPKMKCFCPQAWPYPPQMLPEMKHSTRQILCEGYRDVSHCWRRGFRVKKLIGISKSQQRRTIAETLVSMCTKTLMKAKFRQPKERFGLEAGLKHPLHLKADSHLLFWGSLLANLCFWSHSASLVSLCILPSAPNPSLGLSCLVHPSSAPCSLQLLFQTLKCILHLHFPLLPLDGWKQPATPISHICQGLYGWTWSAETLRTPSVAISSQSTERKHSQPCGIGCKFDPKLSGVVAGTTHYLWTPPKCSVVLELWVVVWAHF